ncbi:MAG: tRNA-dihydrouridine synthase, partial [Lachnospiraceae bacterium]|nr:tRNA-dihydrouridine synthase [Lachnospiraceae bacterium]
VHPRIRDDYYDNKPDPEAFRIFYEKLPHNKIVYNGDLKTPEDVCRILDRFPDLSHIMLGRGLLTDPFLPERIHRICSGQEEPVPCVFRERFSDKEKQILSGFLDELYLEYAQELSEGTALLKMKDIWNFMKDAFPDQEKTIKEIKKSRTGQEYRLAVKRLF